MLSSEEKLKIELEEKYRAEVQKKSWWKSTVNIPNIFSVAQTIAVVIGIFITVRAYLSQNDEKKIQEKERVEETAKEYRKYFYQKQFEFSAEAIESTAILATEKVGSEDYLRARNKFYRLYWGRLSMVEDKMIAFSCLLKRYESSFIKSGQLNKTDLSGDDCVDNRISVTQKDLLNSSYQLAHAARLYTISVWVDSTERREYIR